MLPGSDNAVFRVIASDGANSGTAISAPFSVPKEAPEAKIIGPTGRSFRKGDLVWLQAVAWDPDNGSLDNGSVQWSSSRDGSLGAGDSLPLYNLSVGTHTITMTAHDSDNNTVSDSINLTVSEAPVVEAGAIDDIDCSGSVDAVDALDLLDQLAGLDSHACQAIGQGEFVPFGDADCDGQIGPADVVAVLALAAGVPRGCGLG